MLANWNKTNFELPMEGLVVWTKLDGDEYGERNIQKLKRQGNLWYPEDGGMYVYYTPTHWSYVY